MAEVAEPFRSSQGKQPAAFMTKTYCAGPMSDVETRPGGGAQRGSGRGQVLRAPRADLR